MIIKGTVLTKIVLFISLVNANNYNDCFVVNDEDAVVFILADNYVAHSVDVDDVVALFFFANVHGEMV